ncbi:MAG: hypothetical protein JW812_03220, partial [Alphaproteobacteria bacterium]|nr:hypothetical protein [Alphaproteobacteria bacterium]
PDENFTEKKDILRQMSKEADFNVASSEELKKLITQELDLIPKTVHVVFDSIDTKYALPNFEIKKYFKIGTTGYPHTHEPTFNYLNALKTELSHEEKIEFNFVTAGQRTDQVHHKAQNVLEKIEELNADNFTIKILPYSTQNVLKTVEEIDIWLIANNSSLLKGHKKEGQKYKSIGRAAAGLYAGKPVVCEEIIPSYSLFKNKGIYTLQPSELISFFKKQSPKKVNEEIKKGQKIAQQLGSPERTAKLYLDIFKQYQK